MSGFYTILLYCFFFFFPLFVVVTYIFAAEVSSIEWEFINMTEQEEDLIFRMYKLVGDRWALIAGRIPGRKAEEIERFWIMRHGEVFASRRRELKKCDS
ncbi:MYB-like transcription factor ETC3 isoform X1 [Ziziphus jujuba]|uniref:MYB-like transcription factor ETC3 isoform X1 n=1 Tax=Ziziphus jujuba TaxID=326968 RepID=A0ABM3IS89_ZIZJJ|nr:MYB-like transcription factor ETC3 isoform X1 [Ziziphus jujuba]